MLRRAIWWVGLAGACAAAVADEPIRATNGLVFPDGAAIPRYLTKTEHEYLADNPLFVPRGPGSGPSGPVHCVAEYEPMEGLCLSWEGPSTWTAILAQMARHITTVGDADIYLAVDSTTVRNNASSTLAAAGVNMSRVRYVVRTMDSIWIRDYGPRYIYEGNCRAIVDHVYNRPRPNDNTFPIDFAALKHHARYDLPLVHGGGNYHLEALGGGYCTRLINNENPGRSEQQIHDLWQAFQNLDTTFFDPYPTTVDSTQHIDMWMQMIADRAVVISDWPANSGSVQDLICDSAAATLAARGFTVYRVPARRSGGVHYTYTNVVMCNDLVLLPLYTNPAVSPYNSQALATWQAALPNKTIVQINCEDIVSAAGVMHCIVMHVPKPVGGVNPTVYLKTVRGGQRLQPGQMAPINWISDDDVAVTNVDIQLSTDGGATWPTTIAAGTADDGTFTWTVPDVLTVEARVRVVAHDADEHSGSDESERDFAIAAVLPCPEDVDQDGSVGLSDLASLLAGFGGCAGAGGYEPAADIDADGCVGLSDLAALLSVFGSTCP